MALAILADDLTGACDSAAPFAGRGQRDFALTRAGARWPVDADVVALNTDSRALGAAQAAARVRDCRLTAPGPPRDHRCGDAPGAAARPPGRLGWADQRARGPASATCDWTIG